MFEEFACGVLEGRFGVLLVGFKKKFRGFSSFCKIVTWSCCVLKRFQYSFASCGLKCLDIYLLQGCHSQVEAFS